ncbi:MAG: cytochrome c [Nitrospinota bacterium]|nr:MAG: cytochrome c [Nitrospinota bacterium]
MKRESRGLPKPWWYMAGIGCVLLTTALAASRGVAERGRPVYQRYCAPCHGSSGTGSGYNAPALQELKITPRNHTQKEVMQRLTDEELYRAIAYGRVDLRKRAVMPAWGRTLTPEQIWDLIAYIRTLAR